MSQVVGLFNYWAVIALMMTGLYILIARYNLIKKLIGLGVFQTSIFYLYITLGKVDGGTAPILVGGHGGHGDDGHGGDSHAGVTHGSDGPAPLDEAATAAAEQTATDVAIGTASTDTASATDAASASLVDAAGATAEVIYSNPVPHVLILTAIVVGVATTAVGLALAVRIHETFGTIEEDEIKAIEAQEPDS